MKNARFIGFACIIITTICYGLIPAFSFMAYGAGAQTETLLFDKFFYAAILMWAVIIFKKIDFRIPREAWKPMAAVLVAYIGIATFLYMSFDYISGSLATIISFMYPAFVVAFEMVTGKEKVSIKRITAVVISMVGMCLIVWGPDMKLQVLGVIFALLCAVSYTVYALALGSPSLKGVHPLVTPAYVLGVSAVFNFFRCIISGKPLFTDTPAQLMYILLLAVICAFVAILCYCVGVRLIGSSNAAIINTFEPACACVFSYFLVGDAITLSMIGGGVLIILAVLLTALPDRRQNG
ncbi:MAG: DMT family transporter [Firmicutes bacterium]|nr:DMT family transporter [Bacillota bacterium]